VIALAVLVLFLQQPDLERQARTALEKADRSLTDARAAYGKHDLDDVKTKLQDVQAQVELASSSLAQTGKDARRRPKHFKYGETKTREMLKRIDSFENDMDIDDRALISSVRVKVQEIHDAWLLGIMGEKQ
jgi:hypothetical protein